MQTDSHIEVVSPDRYYAYSRRIQKGFSVIVNHRVKRG